MELAASVCIIILTVVNTLLPMAASPRVLGTKVATDSSVQADALSEAKEAAREERQAARDEFRERLAEIKDAQKREVLEHVGQVLDQINERWTAHFDNVLSRLSEILVKIGTRADKLEEDGQDVASVRDAIADAEAAIEAAQDAIDTQAGNSYVIDITDEESLKDDVKSTRDELHTDLTATRDEVRTARQAVHDAFQALKDVRSGQDTEEEVTDEE